MARRIGVVFTGPLDRLGDLVENARAADELGYSSVWQAEDPSGPDAVSLLASYAAVTRTVKLGTPITPLYARHPVLLATTFASLDNLSQGRMILGLGAGMGWLPRLTLDRASLHPVRDMAETIRVFRELIRDGEAEYHGRLIELRHAFPWKPFTLEPLIRDRIPVYVGAQGPEMVRLAGRLADGIIVEISPIVATIPERLAAVRHAAGAAGRHATEIDIVALALMGATADGSIEPEALRRWVAPRIARLDDARAAARGFDLERMARLRAAVTESRLDDAVALLVPEMIDACGAFGTPEHCLEWLERMPKWGVNEPVILPTCGDVRLGLRVGAEYAGRD